MSLFRDSVGNVYRKHPGSGSTGESHTAKGTRNKLGKRARNPNRNRKFQLGYARTEANKKRRRDRRERWLKKRRS